MTIAILSTIFGLALLLWSADRFVTGASLTAKYFGMSPLLIGILIVGFGTSAPEMVVSIISSLQGNSEIALGNAYGSNIANISLILGTTAIISPIYLNSTILKKELPILTIVTSFCLFQALDNKISFLDSVVLLILFLFLTFWSIKESVGKHDDSFSKEMEVKNQDKKTSLKKSFFILFIGLIFLIISSKILVWGAVEIAKAIGLSDMIIGLTIVAIGTSLPELASSIIATKKGEHDIAFGNVIGSNLFNTLVVVGIAGIVRPFNISNEIIYRDILYMFALTVSLFIIGYGFRGRKGRVNRLEGTLLLTSYIIYAYILIAK